MADVLMNYVMSLPLGDILQIYSEDITIEDRLLAGKVFNAVQEVAIRQQSEVGARTKHVVYAITCYLVALIVQVGEENMRKGPVPGTEPGA